MMDCPICGRRLGKLPKNWRRQEWFDFNTSFGAETPSASIAISPGISWVKKEPARAASVPENVVVPVLESLACGASLGILTAALTVAFDWPTYWPLVALGGGVSISWFPLMRLHHSLLWKIEEITRLDLDGDGKAGRPEQRSVVHEFVDKEARHVRRHPFDAEIEGILERVAKAVLEKNRRFSRRGLKGVLSEEEYNKVTNTLLEQNLIFLKNENAPNLGYEITERCRRILKSYI